MKRLPDIAKRFITVRELWACGYATDMPEHTPDGRLTTVKRGERINGAFGEVVFVGVTAEGGVMLGDTFDILGMGETDAERLTRWFDATYPLADIR